MRRFLVHRWFLIVLVLMLVVGSTMARHLGFLLDDASAWGRIRQWVVACVLFLMALPLEASSMWNAARRPWAPLLAVLMNYGLLPLFAWTVAPVLAPALAGGLMVAASTPCTLASASVWTRRAGGNDSVAILVTMLTNATCFVVTPLWLFTLTGQISRSISLQAMILKLAMLVVLPMLVAQVLRCYRPLGTWATRHKMPLSVVAQCGILYMVLMGAIRSGQRMAQAGSLMVVDWLAMFVAVAVVHLVILGTGFAAARVLRFSRADSIAVGFAGSQKTLMIGLQTAMDAGLDALPMVAYHVTQLFLDTLIADHWRKAPSRPESEKTTSDGTEDKE